MIKNSDVISNKNALQLSSACQIIFKNSHQKAKRVDVDTR
jgi:hypothetical protein